MSESTELTVLTGATPLAVIQKKDVREAVIAAVTEKVRNHVPDVSTAKGRDAITSLAWMVTRTKTAIDEAGKKLGENARRELDAINSVRTDIRKKLEVLADEAKAPLTAWENMHEAQVEKATQLERAFKAMRIVESGTSLEDVRKRVTALKGKDIVPAEVGADLAPQLAQLRDEVVAELLIAVVRLEKEEADRAELLRLQQEAREREAVEAQRKRADAQITALNKLATEADNDDGDLDPAKCVVHISNVRDNVKVWFGEDNAQRVLEAVNTASAALQRFDDRIKARLAEAERVRTGERAREVTGNVELIYNTAMENKYSLHDTRAQVITQIERLDRLQLQCSPAKLGEHYEATAKYLRSVRSTLEMRRDSLGEKLTAERKRNEELRQKAAAEEARLTAERRAEEEKAAEAERVARNAQRSEIRARIRDEIAAKLNELLKHGSLADVVVAISEGHVPHLVIDYEAQDA